MYLMWLFFGTLKWLIVLGVRFSQENTRNWADLNFFKTKIPKMIGLIYGMTKYGNKISNILTCVSL